MDAAVFHIGHAFFCIGVSTQNCKPAIDIKANVCETGLLKDSIIWGSCKDCYPGLKAADRSYFIISFLVTAGGEGLDGDIHEASNQGAVFTTMARQIMSMLRSVSFVGISCIKARYENGVIYVLQPLFIELK